MDLFIAMRTFVEVVQSGSMNAAARKLNVSSALVGQRIAALENHLQVRLLNRTTRQHSLTDFGESYLEQCRDILELVARTDGKASDQMGQPQGRLRIAAPVSFGCEALMPALKRFTDATPSVEIELILSDSNEDLVAGGFDAAFRIGKLEDSTLLQIQLAPYRMAVCASAALVLEHGEPHAPEDLDRFGAVLFSRTGRRPWRFTKGDDTQNWTPKAKVSVNSAKLCVWRRRRAWESPCCQKPSSPGISRRVRSFESWLTGTCRNNPWHLSFTVIATDRKG